jgi:hypothetical protein
MRQHHAALVALVRHLVALWAAPRCLSEARDRSGVPTREAPRRGAGWWPGLAALGWRNRRGWDAGFPRRRAVHPVGVMTGLGCGPARATEPPLADPCWAWRPPAQPQLPSVGAPARGASVVDKGCEGQAHQARGWQPSGAQGICPPQRQSRSPWPQPLRRWRAGGRQSVATVHDQLFQTFRLARERPHDLSGFRTRVAAKVARHNCCMWLNEPLGRPRLAFTDLVDW